MNKVIGKTISSVRTWGVRQIDEVIRLLGDKVKGRDMYTNS